MGQVLARTLNNRIDNLVSEDRSRSDIISGMADEAGISVSTVNQILNASINCPPLLRLRGFAVALDMALGTIRGAAEEDGCTYDDDSEVTQALHELEMELGYVIGVFVIANTGDAHV